jgi:cytochrome c oxidase cbb3-type subunit 3
VVDYVLSLSGASHSRCKLVKVQTIFAENCAACHADNGMGQREFGAPNLTDKIWLFGGSKEAVYNSVFYAHAGVMPDWSKRLDENTIRQLAVYVHSLGGGEKTPAQQ